MVFDFKVVFLLFPSFDFVVVVVPLLVTDAPFFVVGFGVVGFSFVGFGFVDFVSFVGFVGLVGFLLGEDVVEEEDLVCLVGLVVDLTGDLATFLVGGLVDLEEVLVCLVVGLVRGL